jgi:hemerythrin
MSPAVFNQHYALGIDAIDHEHWHLISMMNTLAAAIQRHDLPFTKECMKLLRKDLAEHFTNEEHLMEEINYPFAEYHKAIHAGLLQSIADLASNIDRGHMHHNLTNVLHDAIVGHMDTADLQLGTFCKKQLQTETHI